MTIDTPTSHGMTLMQLAMLPKNRLEQIEIAIHPVEGRTRRCFAASIHGNGLRGGSGKLLLGATGDPALFQTSMAAARLMELLHIPNYWLGEARRFEPQDPVRCYRLHGDALSLCKACAPIQQLSVSSTDNCADYLPIITS